MSKPPLGFVPEPLVLPLSSVLPSRKTPEGLLASRKFKQITASIEAVGLITNQNVEARVAGASEPYRWAFLSGVNQGYFDQAAKVYSFQARAPGYADDAAVWAALATRDDVVAVKPSLIGPEGQRFRFGPDTPENTGESDMPEEFDDPEMRQFRGPRFRLADVQPGISQLPELYLELNTTGQDGVRRQRSEP